MYHSASSGTSAAAVPAATAIARPVPQLAEALRVGHGRSEEEDERVGRDQRHRQYGRPILATDLRLTR
jgi:hypothetical protein